MSSVTRALILVLVLLSGSSVSLHSSYSQDKTQSKKEESKEEREARRRHEKLESLSKKLARRVAVPRPSEENTFLHSRASDLLERMKKALEDPYLFDPLSGATDALLEASQKIFRSHGPRRANAEDAQDQQDAAIALQRYYFRVVQAEYFAGLSGDREANDYVKLCRSLYQQARAAYDSKEYERAQKLGEASSYIVKALEYLAQASVRIPEPPRLQ